MNRTLRVLIVICSVGIVAVTSFVMGFGTAYLVGGISQRAAVACVESSLPVTLPAEQPVQLQAPTSATPLAHQTAVPSTSRGTVRDVQDNFQLFWDALKRISDNYYDQSAINTQEMVHGAIKGMVETLDDPHTYFSPADQVQRSREDLEGSFEGIGATIEKNEDRLTVVAPIDGTPAQRAGIKPGDWIQKVDGKDTTPLSANDGVALIRGPKGTTVTLTIAREGVAEPFDLAVVRDVISVPNVKLTMLDGNIAYLQLVNVFSAKMSDDVTSALADAKKKGATKIIVDVRGNPGGYLTTSVQVASQFLKSGVVAYELTRDGKKTAIPVQSGGLATGWPIVVLINKGSASASEIVAGAIQDSGRGILIGEVTYGKGSVQQEFALSDGSAVHVTVANWLTPKGRSISKVGLTPDIEVKLTEEDVAAKRDTQLQRAVEYLTTGQ